MFDAKRHQFCQWKLTLGNNENQLTFFNWEIMYKANDCMIYIRICHTYSFEKLMFLIGIEPPKCSPSLYVHWLCSSFIYPSPSDRVNHSRDELPSMRCIYDVLPLQLPVICHSDMKKYCLHLIFTFYLNRGTSVLELLLAVVFRGTTAKTTHISLVCAACRKPGLRVMLFQFSIALNYCLLKKKKQNHKISLANTTAIFVAALMIIQYISMKIALKLEVYILQLKKCAVNTLMPRQNGRHFLDGMFKCIFLNENV